MSVELVPEMRYADAADLPTRCTKTKMHLFSAIFDIFSFLRTGGVGLCTQYYNIHITHTYLVYTRRLPRLIPRGYNQGPLIRGYSRAEEVVVRQFIQLIMLSIENIIRYIIWLLALLLSSVIKRFWIFCFTSSCL